MVYQGHFENGVVIFDEVPDIAEGAVVQVVPLAAPEQAATKEPSGTTLAQRLLKHSGTVDGLPEDASENLDHYLYGTPKR